MDKDKLRKSDFKTGALLIVFSLWFLSITFLFMPFKETYGGVANVWYVSPWIFPAIVLTLLLILSVILTINAMIENGMRDLVVYPEGQISKFHLTGLGLTLVAMLAIALAAGLWYLIVNIEEKIQSSLDEIKWLADPSKVQVFEWSDPLAVIPLTAISLLLAATLVVLGIGLSRRTEFTGKISAVSDSTAGFFIISLLFCMLIYVFIPRVDFFVAILLFLFVFTSVFYVDVGRLSKITMGAFLVISALAALVFITGLDAWLNTIHSYTADFAILAATIALMAWSWKLLAGDANARSRYRTALLVSWLTPLVLVPAFRFGLLVPLPYEGGVIELMHQLRYLVK
jgi:hypothetical protein